MNPRARHQRREPGDEVERSEDDGARAVLPVPPQAVDDAPVLGQRQALARDRRTSEVAGEALRHGVVVGLERELGVQREASERGAQLARQGERPGLPSAAERLEAWLAALRQHAAALERGGIDLGEERLVRLGLDLCSFTTQPTAAREMPQDATVEGPARSSARARNVWMWRRSTRCRAPRSGSRRRRPRSGSGLRQGMPYRGPSRPRAVADQGSMARGLAGGRRGTPVASRSVLIVSRT